VRTALTDVREAALADMGVQNAEARARTLPHAYVRLHLPPRVPLELAATLRDAAAALAHVRAPGGRAGRRGLAGYCSRVVTCGCAATLQLLQCTPGR
jgi:hypothetical protein